MRNPVSGFARGNVRGIAPQRARNPVFDGSYCGNDRVCVRNKCANVSLSDYKRVHGGWTGWRVTSKSDPQDEVWADALKSLWKSDCLSGDCSNVKSSVLPVGACRIVKEFRTCSRPFPRNGGATCRGTLTTANTLQAARCVAIAIQPLFALLRFKRESQTVRQRVRVGEPAASR